MKPCSAWIGMKAWLSTEDTKTTGSLGINGFIKSLDGGFDWVAGKIIGGDGGGSEIIGWIGVSPRLGCPTKGITGWLRIVGWGWDPTIRPLAEQRPKKTNKLVYLQ